METIRNFCTSLRIRPPAKCYKQKSNQVAHISKQHKSIHWCHRINEVLLYYCLDQHFQNAKQQRQYDREPWKNSGSSPHFSSRLTEPLTMKGHVLQSCQRLCLPKKNSRNKKLDLSAKVCAHLIWKLWNQLNVSLSSEGSFIINHIKMMK